MHRSSQRTNHLQHRNHHTTTKKINKKPVKPNARHIKSPNATQKRHLYNCILPRQDPAKPSKINYLTQNLSFSTSSASSLSSPLDIDGKPKDTFSKRSIFQKFGLTSAKDIELSVEQHKNFNRWRIVPAAMLTHASLGSIFAWSIFNQPLMNINGVIEQTATDWSLAQVMPVFSTTMSCFGLASFLCGRAGINEKFGPRITTLIGSGGFASAFALSAFATSTHNLPLLYAAYGMIAGTSVGTAYVGPIATLMRWFPDKKGLASALAVAGFGSGAVFASQLIERLLAHFHKFPTFLGPADSFHTTRKNGQLYATINNKEELVVNATEATIKRLGKAGEHLEQGLYLVGSGDIGVTKTFLVLGAIYSCIIAASAFVFRLPHDRYDPTEPENIRPLTPKTTSTTTTTTTTSKDVTTTSPKDKKITTKVYDYMTDVEIAPNKILKARQFWLLWTGLMLNSSAAYCIIGSAKNLMLDVYGGYFPTLITSAFAATFVSVISTFNLGGRLGWGAVSDKIGRKRTFDLLWGLSVPFYLSIPLSAHLLVNEAAANPGHLSYMPLAVFYGGVCLTISCFGGCASVSPAYLSDLFGSKHAGANAGQLLSYLVVAGYAGPLTFTTMHKFATQQAIENLAAKVDMVTFTEHFGATQDNLKQLIDEKVVTIPKLMEIVPPGTQDPSPYLYDTIFITLAALQFVGLMLNRGITKVDAKALEGKGSNSGNVDNSNSKQNDNNNGNNNNNNATKIDNKQTSSSTVYSSDIAPKDGYQLINNMVSVPKFNYVLIRDEVYKAHAQATKYPPTGAAAAAAAQVLHSSPVTASAK